MPKSLSPVPIRDCTKQLISLSIQLRSHENNPAACNPAYGRFFSTKRYSHSHFHRSTGHISKLKSRPVPGTASFFMPSYQLLKETVEEKQLVVDGVTPVVPVVLPWPFYIIVINPFFQQFLV